MSISFLEILIVAAVIGLVVLLARRARPFLLGVLGVVVGGALAAILVLGWGFLTVRHHHHEASRQMEMATRVAESFPKPKKHHKHKEHHHHQPPRLKEHLKPPRLVDPMRTPPPPAAGVTRARAYSTPAQSWASWAFFASLSLAGLVAAALLVVFLVFKSRPHALVVVAACWALIGSLLLFVHLLDNDSTAPLPEVTELLPQVAPLPETTAGIPLHKEGSPPEPNDEPPKPPQSDRPAWVGRPDGIEGGAYHTVVVSDPYTTKRECDLALNAQLIDATQNYLAARLGERAPEELPVDLAYIRHRVCKDEYTEIMDTSVGPMRRVHVLLEFDEPVARDLMRRAHAALVRQRLFQAGGAAAAVLAALVGVFGYLSLTKAKGA